MGITMPLYWGDKMIGNIEIISDKIYADIVKYPDTKRNLDKLVNAVRGDKETEMSLISDNRPLPFAPNYTYGMMNSMVIHHSRKLLKSRVDANVEVAVAGIVILVALIIGVLIMTQVKGTALDVATGNNDTEAVNLINTVFNTGKAGLIILALSVLVLGAVVIIGYLRGMGGGK